MAKTQNKESELDKARGKTESQQEIRAYHEGEFQTKDPVTGQKRGELALHARPEFQFGAIETEPYESADASDDAPKKSAKKAAKKSAGKKAKKADTAVAPLGTQDFGKA
jgi:hypothetical protein